jgi:6-pyruvoyltetrahydropterin/6-carboxytetrahydropterin synthase
LFTISVTTTFRAGHQLKLSDAAEPYHSHDWIVEAAVGGESLDKNELLFDFQKLKKILDEIVSPFNDQSLEDFQCFKNMNISTENIARYIFGNVKKQLPKHVSLLYIELTENAGCKVKYGEKESI